MNIQEHPVYNEVATAYADCGPLDEMYEDGVEPGEDSEAETAAYKKRNLSYRASQAVDPATAQAIMEKVCPGYNTFEPSLLGFLPDDCKVTLAREGSVCIYVKKGEKKLPTANKLKADEYSVLKEDTYAIGYHKGDPAKAGREYGATDYGGYKGEVRIWWD